VAAFGRSTPRIAAVSALALGVMLLVAATMPTFTAELGAMVVVGAASTVFIAVSNSVLQLRADPRYRGRVLSLFSIAFLGTTPLGAPVVGWIGEHFGPRTAFGFGAVAAIGAAVVALALLSRLGETRPTGLGRVTEPVQPGALEESAASA
jgi:predicted MFS family arabinose efflux permease